MSSPPRLVVIACGALAREIRAVVEQNGLDGIKLACLPAKLHNRPNLIAEAVLAIHQGLTAAELAHAVHAHPTLPEAMAEAALDVGGLAIHVPPRRRAAAART